MIKLFATQYSVHTPIAGSNPAGFTVKNNKKKWGGVIKRLIKIGCKRRR